MGTERLRITHPNAVDHSQQVLELCQEFTSPVVDIVRHLLEERGREIRSERNAFDRGPTMFVAWSLKKGCKPGQLLGTFYVKFLEDARLDRVLPASRKSAVVRQLPVKAASALAPALFKVFHEVLDNRVEDLLRKAIHWEMMCVVYKEQGKGDVADL